MFGDRMSGTGTLPSGTPIACDDCFERKATIPLGAPAVGLERRAPTCEHWLVPSMFDEVLAGSRPGEVVFEVERTFAFLDAEPRVVGHALVVSKLLVDRVYDLPAADYEELWAAVRMLAPVLQAVTRTQRVVVLVAGFEVPHAHVHLMPGNTRQDVFGREPLNMTADELASLAATVRSEIGRIRSHHPG